MKLSSFQIKAIKCIADHGGTATAEGGGWWQGADGARLEVEPEPNSCSGIVGTKTIYALESRGLLERVDARAIHRSTRRLTAAGHAALTPEQNSH